MKRKNESEGREPKRQSGTTKDVTIMSIAELSKYAQATSSFDAYFRILQDFQDEALPILQSHDNHMSEIFRAWYWENKHHYNKAAQIYEHLHSKGCNEFWFYIKYGTYLSSRNHAKSLILFETGLQKFPFHAPLHFAYAKTLIVAGRFQGAINHFAIHNDLEEDSARGYLELGKIYINQLDDYERGSKYLALADLFDCDGKFQTEIAMYSLTGSFNPDKGKLESSLLKNESPDDNMKGLAYARLGKMEEDNDPKKACAYFKIALQYMQEEFTASIHQRLGCLQVFELDQTEEGVSHLRAAFKLANIPKEKTHVAYILANLFKHDKNYEEATKFYKHVLEHDCSEWMDAPFYYADMLADQGDLDNAQRMFNKYGWNLSGMDLDDRQYWWKCFCKTISNSEQLMLTDSEQLMLTTGKILDDRSDIKKNSIYELLEAYYNMGCFLGAYALLERPNLKENLEGFLFLHRSFFRQHAIFPDTVSKIIEDFAYQL